MATHKLYWLIGLCFIGVGLFGWLRTGSLVPLVITGSAGFLTLLLGLWLRTPSYLAGILALFWFAIFGSATLYSAFGKISAHTQARPEAVYLFLSMAILCGLGFAYTIRELLQRRKKTI